MQASSSALVGDYIGQVMSEQHIPGLALAVQQGGSVLHEGYYGAANLEHDVAVRAETVFEIASVTKVFTAQLVVRLIQDGRLKLGDRLVTLVDNLPDVWRDVTMLHLLTHQSGIPNYTDVDQYWKITREAKTHEQLLDLVRDLPLNFVPGARTAYSNTGFYLLGLVIEAMMGQPYADALRTTIFDPLGMTYMQVNRYDPIIPHRAQGYELQDGKLVNREYYDTSNMYSAGIILSNVRDLLRWQATLFDDSILNAKSRKLWWTPHPSAEQNEREMNFTSGLAWFRVDDPFGQFWGHTGGVKGFTSAFLYFPTTDVTVITLSNAGHVKEIHKLAFEVIEHLGLRE